MAQVGLTYTYNFDDPKYQDYVCILSVLAQIAIDNAKRTFDIDLTEEIKRIKQDMSIKEYGYPAFWSIIRRDFNKSRINKDLKCPMNYIFNIELPKYHATTSTLPMEHFFVKYDLDQHARKSRRVEELITKYSLDLYSQYQESSNSNTNSEDKADNYLLLRSDFDQLIEDIQQVYISNNYVGLMSWLINRAFTIGAGVKSKKNSTLTTQTDKNKAILLKTLYKVNPQALLKCFAKNKKVVND